MRIAIQRYVKLNFDKHTFLFLLLLLSLWFMWFSFASFRSHPNYQFSDLTTPDE
ncbi:hypothetical protein Hanom_Chr04g00365371 [Helianthus anomalus]